ncbi:hypothetical protein MW354_000302 [Acinetobacter baumannii]|nr:hypothetical protein [Acinetobacter baumannii]EJB8474869.1 hypothetical protein [Acinetobacter baumannii]EJB8549503.1 hypothetical protein [Acinetobacter baumannii]EJB8566655.1 hypothetical protein [Acinetobacter baumannii]
MNEKKFIKVAGLVNAKDVINHAPDKAQRYSPQYEAYYKQGKATWMWLEGYKGWTKNEVFKEPYDQAIDLLELERLVESIEIVTKLGGISEAKEDLLICNLSDCGETVYLKESGEVFRCSTERLKQAISDYEDVYTNDFELQIQYGIPVMSNTKAGCVYFPSTCMTIGIDLAIGSDWSATIQGDNS